MGKINVLSFAVANLIAAGEVVDRPASVIKELTENAIDSGADAITVEIQNGGVTLMRVTDNGCGIERDDLPVAVRRHATSKIKDESDLAAIMTLGFRGEALAAISAISDVRIVSKPKAAANGAAVEVSGGVIIGVGDRACRDGTTVIVENLFANVPARRKFLKKDITETMAVTAVVEKIALSHPEIAFTLITDGNRRLETAGDGNLQSAIYAVFGRDFTKSLIEISGGIDGIKVTGFIGRTDNCRVNRNYQNFFINGRYIRCRTAQAALEQAYVSYIPPEKFPVCVMNIEINPALVDVNVHPSKLEVKFSNEKPVFEAVYYSVRSALEQNATRPEIKFEEKPSPSPLRVQTGTRLSDSQVPIVDSRPESLGKRQLRVDVMPQESISISPEQYVGSYIGNAAEKEAAKEIPVSAPASPAVRAPQPEPPEQNTECVPTPQPERVSQPAPAPARVFSGGEETADYRIIGEAFNSYIIVERGETMIIIDKHAAHERIIFERLKSNMKNAEIVTQILMLPIELMLRTDEIQALEDYRSEVEATGFSFTSGRNTVNITAVPDGIDSAAAADVLAVVADRLLNGTGSAGLTRGIIFEKALYQGSCKAAIKAGRQYPAGYSEKVVSELMKLPDITFCPHGRPVAMEMPKRTLDRQFGRE